MLSPPERHVVGFEMEEGKPPLKTDVRFGPFIPETFLELLGIAMVFFGIGARFIGYIQGFFGAYSLSAYLGSTAAAQAMGLFLVGMFLLYFLDFDLFLEDRRVLRNIVAYLIVFLCLYRIELIAVRSLNGGSVLTELAKQIPLPNMFGTIACYFMITYFLFQKPRWMKKRWQLITHRLLALLPIFWIVVSWIIYKGNGVFFTLDWPDWLYFLFNCERLPFSILAISYLVGLYFLRLYYRRKYGENNAAVYFNSNRFLWQKNVFTVLIIGVVAIVEACLAGNATAVNLDMGNYAQIAILIPLVLFYRPHQGPRNRPVDWTILGLYVVAIVLAYAFVAFSAIVGFATSLS